MTNELKHALEVIKKHCDTPKGKSFDERMETLTLPQQIRALKSKFVWYIDRITINYFYTQRKKENPNWIGDFTHIELKGKQREDAIQELEWFKRDIEACISHLKK